MKTTIKFTEKELHDLYDMLYMLDHEVVKLNKCEKSLNSIFDKIEKIVVPGLYAKYHLIQDVKEVLNEHKKT